MIAPQPDQKAIKMPSSQLAQQHQCRSIINDKPTKGPCEPARTGVLASPKLMEGKNHISGRKTDE
jgi:hypothetical protein